MVSSGEKGGSWDWLQGLIGVLWGENFIYMPENKFTFPYLYNDILVR